MRDGMGERGRLRRIAYYFDTPETLLCAADTFVEEGTPIDAGPGKHGLTQAFFNYVFEPGGNWVEMFSGGYPIHGPGWKPIIREGAAIEKATVWFRRHAARHLLQRRHLTRVRSVAVARRTQGGVAGIGVEPRRRELRRALASGRALGFRGLEDAAATRRCQRGDRDRAAAVADGGRCSGPLAGLLPATISESADR